MQVASSRFASAALWPLTIWTSLTHFEEHAADDYVERTTPIVATAIGFWICAIALIILANPPVLHSSIVVDGGPPITSAYRLVPVQAIAALWFVVPSLYAIGAWLFAMREEAYPR